MSLLAQWGPPSPLTGFHISALQEPVAVLLVALCGSFLPQAPALILTRGSLGASAWTNQGFNMSRNTQQQRRTGLSGLMVCSLLLGAGGCVILQCVPRRIELHVSKDKSPIDYALSFFSMLSLAH